MQNIEVLEFIRNNLNWQEQLAEKPYCVNVKWDGNYFLLTYNQIKSDFKNKIVQQCRGSIFKYENGEYTCVCMPFYKFGNYSESYSKDFDWSTAYVTEKIDGSLVNLWYDNGEWHWSTRGCIDAKKAYTNKEMADTIYDRICNIVDNNFDFLNELDTRKCFMFEIVYPGMHTIVTHSKPMLYIIGARSIDTMQEYDIMFLSKLYENTFMDRRMFKVPTRYAWNTLEECLNALSKVDQNNEGYVAVDSNFRRVKIKSPAYLAALSIIRTGKVDDEAIVGMIKSGIIDDFTAYTTKPETVEKINTIVNKYSKLVSILESEYESTKDSFILERKEFSKVIKPKQDLVKAYLFKRYSGIDMTVEEYLNSISNRAISQAIKKIS